MKVTIYLEDTGDEDRKYLEWQVLDSNFEVLHSVPVNKHKGNREAAYLEATQWAKDNGYEISN